MIELILIVSLLANVILISFILIIWNLLPNSKKLMKEIEDVSDLEFQDIKAYASKCKN